MDYKIDMVITKDEHGYFAYCPSLEGCTTEGGTFEEALKNAKEAAALYLSTMSNEEICATNGK